eukprot:6206981-Pleurochrysis_carterae.AAC.1
MALEIGPFVGRLRKCLLGSEACTRAVRTRVRARVRARFCAHFRRLGPPASYVACTLAQKRQLK